ncbi:MAG: M48 family metalloprotease, partial [Bacteroidota bacterium]
MKILSLKKLVQGGTFLVLMILLQACSVNPVTGKREVMFVSESQEIAMGKNADPSIVAQFGLYENETIQKFINDKGQEMAAISHRPHLDYEFKVLDSPVINAFALPGGYVYFTRGILAHFNNEAEFAGVLGHEIGHITARHGAAQQSQQILGQSLFVVGVIASPQFRGMSDVAAQSLGLMFLKFGRDDETQSDQLGVEYSTKIGYDASKMANFFGTLKRIRVEAGADEIPTFMSTHPDPGDRYNEVNRLANQWQAKYPGQTFDVNRDKYLRMIDGLTYGEDPRQGYVESNVFYHPDLKFQFPTPAGWRVNNTPTQVQIYPEDGKAAILMSLGQGNSLDEAANSLIENSGLTVIDRQNTTVNGSPAIEMTSTATSDQQTLRIKTYLIQYGGNIYLFNGLAQEVDFPNYNSQFLNTMRGFRTLTDQSKINVFPDVVKIKTAPRTMTLREGLKMHGTPDSRLDEVAILNQMQLTDQITAGFLFKTLGKMSST